MVNVQYLANDLDSFYTVFSNYISKAYTNLVTDVNKINSNNYYVSVKDNSNRLVIDFYALVLLPNSNDVALQQITLCNSLVLNNNGIDFSTFNTSNIGPAIYTYDNNGQQTKNTYWINNTKTGTLNINTGNTETDALYKEIYKFSFNSILMPMDDYNEIKQLWLGFKSYQEDVSLFYISLTNQGNFGMFGLTDSMPTYANTYYKAITTQSNIPKVYNLNQLSLNSSVICLSNIFMPESLNHEYLPYLYFCIGKDASTSNYIQLEANGVEYIKGLNGLIAVTSNPKLTLYQKISYTLNIYNTNFYTLNGICLIDNQSDVTVEWGDGTPNTTLPAETTDIRLTHDYSPNGVYTLTLYYLSLTNPNLIYNIAELDRYTSKVDMGKAIQLTSIPTPNVFKSNDTVYAGTLKEVQLPPNLNYINVNGFCENRTQLTNLVFPTINCIFSGIWLYNSALQKGNNTSFTYPSNLTFVKDSNNLTNDFYTGNFSNRMIISSSINCDSLYVGDYVTDLTFRGVLTCAEITAQTDYQDNNNCRLTALTITENSSINNVVIHDLNYLTSLNVGGATTTLYNINHLDSLTALYLADTVVSINLITYCNSLTALNISQYVTTINSAVSNYCNSFSSFNVDVNNSNFSTVDGVLYDKTASKLIRIPYGYSSSNLASYELPSTVTTIESYAMFTKEVIPFISIGNNVINLHNNFLGEGHIGTLYINSNILSNSVFTAGTIDNLILTNEVTALNTGIFSNVDISSLTVYDEDIVLNTNMFDMLSLTLIKGYVGSTAETFANDNNITFIPLSFGTNTTVYNITIPTNNYTLSNVCSLSQSYSLIEWGDDSEPEVIYNFDNTLTHTYETAGDYTVTITHIAPASIDFSYTNSNQGLFGVATELDFSGLTLCSNTVTNLFNNLSNVDEIIYPPNIISITNTLNGTNNISSITLPTALTTLLNSFNNQNYNNLSALTLPSGLTTVTNSFNYTNVIKGTTLNLDTTNSTIGLTVTDSFNECSTTITTIALGENVFNVTNSFMNLLTVTTLTVNNSNTHLSVTNNVLCNYAGTELILVPGGLSTFTIPNTVTTLLQGSIANIKTYAEIVIPEGVTTINFPFYNSLNEQSYTTITNLKALNPYTSMADINKIITTTEGETITYLDTANVIGITGYEHSVIHSQIDGYSRYPNCSTYVFTSLGYYNSSIVLGSNYSSTLFTNSQLVAISNNLINKFNESYNYIVPDKIVYNHLSELTTYITTNTFDYTGYPYVIFYYIDTTNNMYNYILYILDNAYSGMNITIDSADTYNSRKITVNYDVVNSIYVGLTDEGSFSSQSIITSSTYNYSVLTFYGITTILTADNTNITPTFLKYTTLIQENPNISDAFIGYVFGSNNTGTNKLFLSDPVIRIDDYWIDVYTTLIDADNIVHINAYNINYNGDFITTTISGSLPLTFNSIGNDLINYTIYGTSEGAGEAIQLGIQLDEPLRGLGDIKDTLDVSTGVLTRRIGVVVLDGTKGQIPDGNTTRYFFYHMADTITVTTTTDQLCSHYSYAIVATGTANVGFRVTVTSTDTTRIAIRSPNTDLDTTEKYRAFYASEYANRRPVTAYYVLANPVTEQVDVPSGLTGTIEGYLTQSGTPTESVPIYPEANGVELPNGKYEVYADVYTIPLTVSGNNSQSQSYDAYIGSSKLYEDEYVDYQEQKVYKRTENLLNPENAVDGYAVTNGSKIRPFAGYSVVYIPCEPSTRYTGWNLATTSSASNRIIGFCDQNKNLIGYQQYSVTSSPKAINTTAETFYIAATVQTSLIGVSAMVTKGNTEPETYVPYFQSTDPPVPFPTIVTYNNENTLTSTEIVGNTILEVSEPILELTEIEEDPTTLKLLKTDKYMFENNVELVSAIYELPTT